MSQGQIQVIGFHYPVQIALASSFGYAAVTMVRAEGASETQQVHIS